MTLADIIVGTILYRFNEIEIDWPVMPNIQRWYQTLQKHPAYQKNVMIPFGEMKGVLTY